MFGFDPPRNKGHNALEADIENLRAAMAEHNVAEAFMPSLAPRALGRNEFYATGEEFLLAISDAMRECRARQKVLILDCCYSGAFPADSPAKGDTAVHTLERFAAN